MLLYAIWENVNNGQIKILLSLDCGNRLQQGIRSMTVDHHCFTIQQTPTRYQEYDCESSLFYNTTDSNKVSGVWLWINIALQYNRLQQGIRSMTVDHHCFTIQQIPTSYQEYDCGSTLLYNTTNSNKVSGVWLWIIIALQTSDNIAIQWWDAFKNKRVWDCTF